jgi:hypothetical protein
MSLSLLGPILAPRARALSHFQQTATQQAVRRTNRISLQSGDPIAVTEFVHLTGAFDVLRLFFAEPRERK